MADCSHGLKRAGPLRSIHECYAGWVRSMHLMIPVSTIAISSQRTFEVYIYDRTAPYRLEIAMALPVPPAPASPSDAWCSNPIGLEDPDLLLLPRALLEAGANGFSSVDPAGPSSLLGEAPRVSALEAFLSPDTANQGLRPRLRLTAWICWAICRELLLGRERAVARDSSIPANKWPQQDWRRTQ